MPAFRSGPAVASRAASLIPANPPMTAARPHSGITSAAVSRANCQRPAPRALSSAVSPSRWATSRRAVASSAATASTSSCSVTITSSDRATDRLLAVALSTAGRVVDSCMPLSPEELSDDCLNADRSPEIADRSVPVNFAMSGWASQVPLSAVSAGPKAAGLISSGPYVVYPLAVLAPSAPIVPIDQYESAEPDSLRGANRPVSRDRKSTRLNSSHPSISYAVFCLKKKKKKKTRKNKKKKKKKHKKKNKQKR